MVTWTSSSSREVFTVPGACGQAQHPLVARQNLGDEPADAAAHGMLLPPRLQDGSEARPLPLRCDLKAALAGFVVGFRKQQAERARGDSQAPAPAICASRSRQRSM
jgi:hypothetical protein